MIAEELGSVDDGDVDDDEIAEMVEEVVVGAEVVGSAAAAADDLGSYWSSFGLVADRVVHRDQLNRSESFCMMVGVRDLRVSV